MGIGSTTSCKLQQQCDGGSMRGDEIHREFAFTNLYLVFKSVKQQDHNFFFSFRNTFSPRENL
jgi:hypothetical protein